MKSINQLQEICLLSAIKNLMEDNNTLTSNIKLLSELLCFDILTLITIFGSLYVQGALEIDIFPSSVNDYLTLKINHEKIKNIFND